MLAMLVKETFNSFRQSSNIIGQSLKHFGSGLAGKIKIIVILLIVSVLFYSSFNIIKLIQDSVNNPNAQNNIDLMTEMLNNFVIADGSTVLTVLLWFAFMSGLTLPVVSNSILSPYSRSSMNGLKINDMHQVTDSLILQFVSILVMAQLFVSLSAFSILRYTYDLSLSIYLLPLGLWLFSGFSTVMLAWLLEYTLRRFGSYFKYFFISAIALILVFSFILFPNLGFNFFGLSNIIISIYDSTMAHVIFFVLVLIAMAIISIITMAIGLKALNNYKPEKSKKNFKAHGYTDYFSLINRIILRTPNIRSPILMILLVLSVSIISTGNSPTLFAFIFALPMVVTMAGLINIYGVLGGGNSWLFSMPKYTNNHLSYFAYYNFILITFLNIVLILPMIFFGIIDFDLAIRFFLTSELVAVIMSIIAVIFAYYKPNKYDVHVRGENILPPSKALVMLVVLIAGGGIPGLVFFVIMPTQFIILAVASLYVILMAISYTMGRGVGYSGRLEKIISSTNS